MFNCKIVVLKESDFVFQVDPIGGIQMTEMSMWLRGGGGGRPSAALTNLRFSAPQAPQSVAQEPPTCASRRRVGIQTSPVLRDKQNRHFGYLPDQGTENRDWFATYSERICYDILPTLRNEGKWPPPPPCFRRSRDSDAFRCFRVSGASASINALANSLTPAYLVTWVSRVGATRGHPITTTSILKARTHSLQLRHPNRIGKAASIVAENDVTRVCPAPLRHDVYVTNW
ncbi:hypothetical protein BJY52DRAFT_1191738 [Lactarius psammicola]|nr:hypothetical protein BJY52DRAFT_1191738 [Lactarius psammicola]